jgi:hypothetical protein
VTSPHETPLDAVSGFSEDVIQRLRALWISTAEQLVATAATPGGMHLLAEELQLSQEAASRLVSAARASLPPTVAAEMNSSVDPSDYGLGAVQPPPETEEEQDGGRARTNEETF